MFTVEEVGFGGGRGMEGREEKGDGGERVGWVCVYMENVLCLGFVVFFCTYKIRLFACI